MDLQSNKPYARVLEDALAAKWFAIYVTSRHEKRIAERLTQKQLEFYLPLYQVERKWKDGSKGTLDLPLFPGYLFVHIKRTERVPVLEVPGVLTFIVGTGGEPVEIRDAEIEVLRTGLSLRHAQPHPFLKAGQRVRIRSGALTGMEGFVVRNKNSSRVVLTINLIMKSVAVEVGSEDLELLDS